jgi:outer membrane protein assembly factor BamB
LESTSPYSSPAIHDDGNNPPVIYMPSTLIDAGAKPGLLFAINATNGNTLWMTAKDNNDQFLKPFFSSPTITEDGKYLLIGQGLHEDKDSPLLCFKLPEGPLGDAAEAPPLAWMYPTPLHVESSPAVFTRAGEQFVVAGAGAIEGKDRRPTGHAGFVFCVNVATGKEHWRFDLPDPESSPAVDENGVVYVGAGFNGNAVVALRSESDAELKGKPRQIWKTPTPFPAIGNVTLASHPTLGNVVFIGLGNGDYVFSDPKPAGVVLALERATGKILWQTPLPDAVLGPLTPSADNTRVLAPCRNGNAYGIDMATGKIAWSVPVSTTPNIPVLAGLVTNGPYTFALAADGTLATLSTASGQMLERIKLSDASKSPQNYTFSNPVLHKDVLYVATETTGLHAFRISP